MPKVHILPPDVISKIAAGEVIDRPASVVKELIENALDAGAESIELQLTQAGKTLIHIKDSGTGIEQDDIETIFHRHSTSKITNTDDLFNIHSLGFRGEALYSVAAIADVILRSRTKDQDTGWEIHMRGGEKLDLRPVSMAVGTDIEVKELFFNTPARRKFLKSNTTEMNQILNIFIPYALLYADRHFLLTHQDKKILNLNPAENLAARVAETLNLDVEHIIETKQSFPVPGGDTANKISVHMLLGDMNITRSRRDMQYLFINNRPVQSSNLSFHINNVYRLILPQGSYPFFVIYLNLPAEDLDVNIHPSKREVKIRDEQTLISILRHMCENTLMTAGQPKQAGLSAEPVEVPDLKGTDVASSVTTEHTKTRDMASQSSDTIKPAFKTNLSNITLPPEIFTTKTAPDIPETSPAKTTQPPTDQYSFPQTDHLSIAGETLFKQKQDNLQSKLADARYIGSFMNKYIFFENDKMLLIVDQHAAQERITFEHLIQQMEKGNIEVQHLLSPYLIRLSPPEILTWEEAKNKLDEIGFASTQFDDETIAVHTYPVLIKDPQKAVQDILAGENVARCDHETIARRACRSSIMSGDTMKQKQAEFMREQLIKCRDPFTCPHGRPTVVEMKENFLNKQFLRT